MPSIFLSSTYVDLAEIRGELSRWLSEVFGADLVIMETFGSDAAPPDITSVRKVRDCDIFVGIYAHRYGTVDPTTGKSITELELDEAERAHSAGAVRDILLYLHDEGSPWPDKYKESSATAKKKLKRLRERAKTHTPSYFRSANDLLLAITRDVHRKLIEHFHASPLRVQEVALPSATKLAQPVGMEFLSSTQRQHLIGRASKLDELIRRIDEVPLLLLLGDSGIGKTSLINAGLVPESFSKGWRPVYVRPLGLPASDVAYQVQTSLFKGRPAYRGPLLPFLLEMMELIPERRLLLIIDQFEDVLVARSQNEVDTLVADLRAIQQTSHERLRVLVSYRADLEGRLGQLWQLISGSASGLPRVYLEGLSEQDIETGIENAARDLNVHVDFDRTSWEGIKRDLALISQTLGLKAIYPPYVQMFIEHIWSSSEKGALPYTVTLYRKARGVDGIVGDYLGRQLEYAEDSEGHVRLVLIALVRSYGVKAQKSLDELVADTGLAKKQIEVALEKLIRLRLVRHIELYYEISHDFIARKVLSELVDSEEKEVKRFQELLYSKAAAFSATGAALTSQELLMLYKHRERLVPGEAELRLLLGSWLEGEGPALYWLLNPAWKMQILTWLSSEVSEDDTDHEERVSAILLRRRLEGGPMTEQDLAGLWRYEYAIELASLIQKDAASLPDSVLLKGLRHKREEVRGACMGVIASRCREGNWSLLVHLRRSTAARLSAAYDELVTNVDVPTPADDGSRIVQEFRHLKLIISEQRTNDAEKAYTDLKKMRPRHHSLLLADGLLAVRRGQIDKLLKSLKSRPMEDAEIVLRALRGILSTANFKLLLAAYEAWNKLERDIGTAPAVHGKTRSLAEAIRRTMRPELSGELRATVARIRLTESARTLVLALLQFGQIEDVELVLGRIAHAKFRVPFWTHTELGQAVARRMAAVQPQVPDDLLKVLKREEFWGRELGEKLKASERLPLDSPENRALYIRLAAYALIGSAGIDDVDNLLRLARHSYGLIARAAAIRLVDLLGADALKRLSMTIQTSVSEREGKSLASAIRFAEIEHYSVANVW